MSSAQTVVMTLRARLRRILLLLGVVYAICCAVLFLSDCLDRLLLHPTVRPVAVRGLQRMALTHLDGEIEVWRYRSTTAMRSGVRLWALEFVGNADRAERGGMFAEDDWGEHAMEVWLVNYPGFGGSSGEAHLADIPPAALAAYDRMAAVAQGAPIIVIGCSMGTAAALYVAAERPIAGLVLRNPPPIQDIILGRHGWWNLWMIAQPVAWRVPAALNSADNARRVRAPAVFVLSMQDEVVPYSFQQLVLQRYAGVKQVLTRRTALHNTPLSADERARFLQMVHGMLAGIPPTH